MSGRVLIRGASELLTCAAGAPDLIGRVPGGSVLIEGETDRRGGRRWARCRLRRVIDAGGRVVMPGFVDCHTHVVFGGSRVDEYVARCAGLEPPPAAPTGIVGTMAATRPLDARALADASAGRLREMLAHGTTTVESKTGYGLARDASSRCSRPTACCSDEVGIDVVSTYLGAHALPPDVDRDAYVEEVVETIPEVAARGLASFCDVYCDDGYFTLAESRRILEAGLAHGLRPKAAPGRLLPHRRRAAGGRARRDHRRPPQPHDAPPSSRRWPPRGVIGVVMPLLDFAAQNPTASPRPHAGRRGRSDRACHRHLPGLLHARACRW